MAGHSLSEWPSGFRCGDAPTIRRLSRQHRRVTKINTEAIVGCPSYRRSRPHRPDPPKIFRVGALNTGGTNETYYARSTCRRNGDETAARDLANGSSMTLRNSTIALWLVISDKERDLVGLYGRFQPLSTSSCPGGSATDVTGERRGFQLAVIHSMRQLISYGRVPDYLPNRSIRIPLTHDACEGVSFDGGD